jgi:hypothetical protein
VVDGAAMLAAAVRAAVLAKAPRRTVQAVAAAVAGVFARPAAVAARGPAAPVPAGSQCAAKETGNDASAEELLAALRSARSAQRKKKKERRCAAKLAASRAANEDRVAVGLSSELDLGGGLPTQEVSSAQARLCTTGSFSCKSPATDDLDLNRSCKKMRGGSRSFSPDSMKSAGASTSHSWLLQEGDIFRTHDEIAIAMQSTSRSSRRRRRRR